MESMGSGEGMGREGKEDGVGVEIEEPLQQIVCCSDDLVKRLFGTLGFFFFFFFFFLFCRTNARVTSPK